MTAPYTEEDVERPSEQVYLDAAKTLDPGASTAEATDWVADERFRAAVDFAFTAGQRAILAALSSANRLVPPGSEVREESGFQARPGDTIAPAVRRRVITTPWVSEERS